MTMTTVFVVCATIGSTILVIQFILTMIGLGGEAMDIDVGGFDADVDFDGSSAGHDGHVSSTWLFGVISFRTIIAALAFFGMTGLAGESAGCTPWKTLALAVAAGIGAMYGVYALMRWIASLRTDGTARIGRSIGRQARVYLTIPGQKEGSGKIQMNLQNRTMEYLAMTEGEKLPTGSMVEIVAILSPNTLMVQPLLDLEKEQQ